MKKIPFIIGLGQKTSEFRSVCSYLNIIQPDWNNGSLAKMKLGKPDILGGFSLGCMIACMHAEKFYVRKLILCSPTPEESLINIKAEEVIFIVGQNEKFCLDNVKRVRRTLPKTTKSRIFVIPEGSHKINGNYKKKLIEIIKSI